jgi:hypothetical protein
MTALESLTDVSSTMPRLRVRYGIYRETAGRTRAVFRVGHLSQAGTFAGLSFQTSDAVRLLVQNLSSPLKVLKPFEITIEPVENAFVASFLEANINASGDSKDEALDNLVSMIRDLYHLFADEINRLGPEPARQYSVLRNHLSL